MTALLEDSCRSRGVSLRQHLGLNEPWSSGAIASAMNWPPTAEQNDIAEWLLYTSSYRRSWPKRDVCSSGASMSALLGWSVSC